jgi:uncharacterized protein (TIGR02246 family)
MRRAFVLSCLLVLAATPAPARGQSYASLITRWAADWTAGNLDAVMALYAPDAVFHPNGSERWSGRAAIARNFAGVLSKFRADLHLHSVRSEASGDLAYDSGTYAETVRAVSGGKKPLHLTGDYVFLFRRGAGGDWKILEQTWTEYGPQKL